MLMNHNYDMIKVTYKLSKLAWFIKECAIPEEKKQNHPECVAVYEALLKDLEKHAESFHKALCE